MPIKPTYLVLTAAGGVVAWSGIKGKGISAVARDILSGQSPKAAVAANGITGSSAQAAYLSDVTSATGSGPCSAAQVASNKALGETLAAERGWIGSQWTALNSLWTRESGWCNTIANASSGAYGIAQALPPTKYPAAAQQMGGSSPAAQIGWGLAYIEQRYGDPITAEQHEVSNGWY